MTYFLTLVVVGLLANLYILIRVSQECWRSSRKSGVVERIEPELPPRTTNTSVGGLRLVEGISNE